MTDLHTRISDSFNAQGLMATLGARLVHVGDGEVHIEMPFSKALSQQRGYVHAGAVTSIVDSACGYAGLTKAPQGCDVVTAEFKINFMRPALGERFLAVGRVQSSGKLLAVCTGEVRAFAKASDTDYKVVAMMQATIVNVAQ
ncbi:PaaI family thioesterase [Variovorax sp. YR752]|uniref:PaaI family thioesterase n=1 Tax=Variovorax sp. YR752 TaxID=1884383 RepID=UPI003137C7EE